MHLILHLFLFTNYSVADKLLNLQKHMVVECQTPGCRLECKAYNFLKLPVAVLASIFVLESPITAELKRLTDVGGLWLEVIEFMWLTAWSLLTMLLYSIWGRIRRCVEAAGAEGGAGGGLGA
jgi:hypothetical protein